MLAELSDLVSSPVLVPHPRVPLDDGRAAPVGHERSDPFVGRDGELARLRAALDEVRGPLDDDDVRAPTSTRSTSCSARRG